MVKLRGAEAVDIDLGKVGLDVVEQLLVPLELEVGMQPALHQDLVAAQRNRLADLLEQHVAVEHVGVGVIDLAVEGAEVADGRADIRVVDVAVNVVGSIGLGVQPLTDRLGGAAELEQAGVSDQGRRLPRAVRRWPSAARCKIAGTVEDKVHSFRGQIQPGGHLGEPAQPRQLGLAELVRQDRVR